jgi:NADH:ubiquinone oxidoreductase subunit 6 (subunit J)
MDGVVLSYYFFIATTALSAMALLFVRSIFHAALAFLACLLSLAALFVLVGAEFPAVSQLILYAGGVVVLILFGIMLTKKTGIKELPIGNNAVLMGVSAGLSMLFLLVYFAKQYLFTLPANPTPASSFNPVQKIGIALMTDYLLPFEIAGLLLLVVLLGAATIAGYKSQR